MEQTVRLDVWAGIDSQDHVARIHMPLADNEWSKISAHEMAQGNLVNLRVLGPGEGWGRNDDFDERVAITIGRG